MQQDVESRKAILTEKQNDRQPISRYEAARERSGRSWLIKALTLLLLVQGAGLILLGTLNLDQVGGVVAILQANYFYATLPALGLLALLAAVGFFTLRPGAWVIALLVQALSLLLCLIYYFDRHPQSFVLYGLMFYGIVMVIYLNYAHVPAMFRLQPGTTRTAPEDHEP